MGKRQKQRLVDGSQMSLRMPSVQQPRLRLRRGSLGRLAYMGLVSWSHRINFVV
jgi:hypothetical protein